MAGRRVWLWVALGAVAVVAAAAVTWAVRRGPDDPPPVGGPASPLLSALPPDIAVGAGTAELPADRAVGRGAFIFNGLRDGAPTYLVTVDGTPYRIGTTGRPGSPRSTLSADGRWLARGRPDGWVIRDLESTREHRAPADLQPVAWSGRSLYWSARYDAYRVMDLASGRLDPAPFTVSATASSLQVISEQEAAVTDAIETMRDDRHPRMRVFDVRTGSDVRTVTLDLTAHLRPGEHSVIYLIPLMHTGGTPRRLWIPVGAEPATPGPEAQPNLEVAALEVDLADGRVVSRVDWSPPRRGDATSLSGAVPDGAVLTHSTSDSTEVIVVPAGGTRRTVTRIAGLVAVYPAGRPF